MRTNFELPATTVPPKIIAPVQRISTQQDLLTLLWNHFDNLEPRIAVSEILIGAKADFLGAVIEEQFIDYSPIYWSEIFSFIRWTEQANSTAHCCGVELLFFMGSLGEAIQKNGGARISKERAIEMMLASWGDAHIYFEFHSTLTRHWVETTPLGVETLGVAICVELLNNEDFVYDDLWDLSVPFE